MGVRTYSPSHPLTVDIGRRALPDWNELFAAFCGHIGDDPDAHPVTRCARRLAELHAARQDAAAAAILDRARRTVIASIDEWVARYAPHAAECGESLGQAVDRMAVAHLKAIAALTRESDETRVHAEWHELGLLATEWSDLVEEAVNGQPPLPGSIDRQFPRNALERKSGEPQ